MPGPDPVDQVSPPVNQYDGMPMGQKAHAQPSDALVVVPLGSVGHTMASEGGVIQMGGKKHDGCGGFGGFGGMSTIFTFLILILLLGGIN